MKSEKSKIVALVLCICGGFLGLHRFYVGKMKSGIVYLLTVGVFGLGWILDAILLLTDNFHIKTVKTENKEYGRNET